uniref:CUB domain-containing protein n=1 Tax=Magallana gigas TaxID=29159 RepID=A0A8W8P4K6_MAGGI
MTIWLVISMVILTGSSMELKSYTACYGNFELKNFLQPSCPDGQKIAVMAVYTLAKYKLTGCPQEQTEPIDPSCCQYDANDCSGLYKSGSYRNYYQTCTGHSSCVIRVSRNNLPSHCNSDVYIERTHYMKMDYYCISDQAVDPCTDLTTSNSPAFIWNTGYPAEITTTSTLCTCSIEMPCDTTVELTAIDLQLKDAKNCKQSVTVVDGSSISTFDCSYNNEFLPKEIYTSSGHFMKIFIENNLGTTGGKFLFLVQGSDPKRKVTISCGESALTIPSQNLVSLPQCPVERDITTNQPTTGPNTHPEDSTSTTSPNVKTGDSTTYAALSTDSTPLSLSTQEISSSNSDSVGIIDIEFYGRVHLIKTTFSANL